MILVLILYKSKLKLIILVIQVLLIYLGENQMISFKMPTAYTTLLILVFIATISTHFIPAGKYKYVEQDGRTIPLAGTYQTIESLPQGLWDIMLAPIEGFKQAISIIIFVLMIGGFLGITMKTGAIDAGVSTLVNHYKGREKLMIPILMGLFSIGGSTYGLAEETIAFYPIIVPLFLLAGYDVVVAMMVIFLGSASGILGGTTNPFSVAIASRFANVSMGDGILWRFVIWGLGLLMSIVFVMRYAKKIKIDPTKSIVYDMRDSIADRFLKNHTQTTTTISHQQIKVLFIFFLTFIIMIVSLIPWQSFGINLFFNINNWIDSLPIIGGIIGKSLPLGEWYFSEISGLFIVSSIIIGKIYQMKEKEIVNNFIDGAKDLLGVALILALSRAIMVIMTRGNVVDTILYTGETALQNISGSFYIVANYLLMFPLGILIPSSSGLAATSMPILAPLADFVGVDRTLIVTAYLSGFETINLVSPTYVVLISGLAISQIPYDRWIRHILPFVLGIIIMCSSVLVIGSLI